MKRLLLCLLGLTIPLLMTTPASHGQGNTNGGKTDTPKLLVQLLDDSTLFATLKDPNIVVNTQFGKLTIPVKNLRSIEFGQHLDEATKKDIALYIEDLGKPVARERKVAQAKLIALGVKAWPALQRAAKGKDRIAAAIAMNVMREIAKTNPPQKLLQRLAEDVVRTNKFTVKGQVVTPVLTARTKHLGDLSIKPEQIYALHWIGGAKQIKGLIDAALHGSAAGKWVETDFIVNPFQKIAITAAGQVDLWPQAPGQYTANPNGRTGTRFEHYRDYGPKASLSGALIGKIGKDGEPFFIGAEFNRAFQETGRLYLHIVPGPWGAASSGMYDVVVSRN